MKNLNKNWQNLKNYLYKHYGQESGKLIVHTGVITWTLSSMAHVGAILFNDKIPTDQKRFLVPREIADGALNIVAFYAITNSLKSLSSRLVSTGKWSNKAIRDFVAKNPSNNIKMGELSTNLPKTYKGNEEFYKAYSPFNNGLGMLSTTVGSVIACNAATPFIRNYYGAKQQKRSIEKSKRNSSIYTSTNSSLKV